MPVCSLTSYRMHDSKGCNLAAAHDYSCPSWTSTRRRVPHLAARATVMLVSVAAPHSVLAAYAGLQDSTLMVLLLLLLMPHTVAAAGAQGTSHDDPVSPAAQALGC